MTEVHALELQGRSAAPKRQQEIVLCCAHSVQTMVEEVAHNLSGLGFSARVVCGAEARAALLGRDRDPASRNKPTIYVVCVQGTLKEQVLQPLRQALATHGGPNEHLFVAVLDLALPLGMVGQIRRFADALERMPGRRRRDPVADRRQWREHFGSREFEGIRTRAHVPLHVIERAATRPGVAASSDRVTGPLRIVSARKPAKIAPTKKYRAVTGAFGVVPEASPSARSRGRARRRAVVPASAARRHDAAGAIDTTTRRAGGKRRIEPRSGKMADARPTEARAPDSPKARTFGDAITRTRSKSRHLGIALVGVATVATVWATGLGDEILARFGSAGDSETVAASQPGVEAAAPDDPDDPDADREIAPARTVGARDPHEARARDDAVEASPAGDESGASHASNDGDPSAADPEGDAVEPDGAVEHDEQDTKDLASPEEPAAAASGYEALEQWVADNRLRKVRNLYVSARQGERTTWDTARHRCKQLEIAGVEGWRLAHRRELKLLDVAGFLVAGRTYWSYTRVADDPEAVYALDTTSRALVEYLRQEPTGEVICVLPSQD